MDLRTTKYLINRFVFLKRELLAKESVFNNFTFQVKTEDAIGRTIYKKGYLERDITEYLINNLTLKKGDIIFDVGANIGWYTILLSHKFNISVFAFEPDATNFDLLEKNIHRNQVKAVTPLNLAISDHDGTADFFPYKKSNRGRHSLLPINNYGRATVPTMTFDSIVASYQIPRDKIKFLKIDVEGYELTVLSSGKNSILGCVPLILSEFSPGLMRQVDLNPLDYINLMSEFGYVPCKIVEKNLYPILLSELELPGDRVKNIFWQLKAAI